MPCNGYRVDNYDGFPPVLCSVEADMHSDEQFTCEDCLLNEASERMDEGEDVEPALVAAVNQRDWERRR